jgi:hypothetical protein
LEAGGGRASLGGRRLGRFGPRPGCRRPRPAGCRAGRPSPAARRCLRAGGRCWLGCRGRAASTASWTRRTSADTPFLPLIPREGHLEGACFFPASRPSRPGAWRGRRRGSRRRGSRLGNGRRSLGVGGSTAETPRPSVRRTGARSPRGRAAANARRCCSSVSPSVFISFNCFRNCETPKIVN